MNIDTYQISDIQEHSIDVKNRELFLHSHINTNTDNPGVEYRMASNFIKNIRILDSQDNSPILIHMHSIGGNWNDGMAIFDSITMSSSHVTILTYGQAESMSSIILQAADLRIMTENSYFMCHFGSNGYEGNFLDVQNASKFEELAAQIMINIYANKAIKGKFFKDYYKEVTPEKVGNFIKRKLKDGDWYMGPQEAINYGFADHLMNTSSKKLSSIKDIKDLLNNGG